MHVTSPISAGDDALFSKSRSSRFSLHARKKKLAISHSSSTKIISTFRSGRKSFRKDPANNFFKIINMTRYLVTLLTQSPNLKWECWKVLARKTVSRYDRWITIVQVCMKAVILNVLHTSLLNIYWPCVFVKDVKVQFFGLKQENYTDSGVTCLL